jgi:hypothetical protein
VSKKHENFDKYTKEELVEIFVDVGKEAFKQAALKGYFYLHYNHETFCWFYSPYRTYKGKLAFNTK